jgi:lysophospholipase L1-like esterase
MKFASLRISHLATALLLAITLTLLTNTATATPLVKSGEKIAFLGDSITAAGWANPKGYVRLVIAGLKANDIDTQPIPAGISGHKSNQMLERLQRDVLDKNPDWMTLSCGVNDVWHGAKGIPLDQYKTNITAIVDRCQAKGVKVMILTATVIGEDLQNDNNKKLAAYNDFLRTLARKKNCPLADLNKVFQQALKNSPPKDGHILTVDGVHMNSDGNRLMAQVILQTFGLDRAQLKTAEDSWSKPTK